MIRKSGGRTLPVIMLVFGIAALGLRWGLYATALDAKGLLIRQHPLALAVTVLTLGVLIRIALAVRKQEDTGHAPAGLPAAIGNLAAGAGILATVLMGTPVMGGYLASGWRILGLAAPVCLLLAAVALALGKKPFFLLYVVVCLFFVVHIVTRYQIWSGNPQLQDYVFSLLGAMALTLFSFYEAAEAAGCGSFRMKQGMGLAAVYLCTAELARSSCPVLYLGGILWVLTGLCSTQKK